MGQVGVLNWGTFTSLTLTAHPLRQGSLLYQLLQAVLNTHGSESMDPVTWAPKALVLGSDILLGLIL